MTMPLNPVMFPEIEGPEFVRSSEMAELARDVLAEHGAMGGVADAYDTARAIADEEIHVLWLLNCKTFDEATEERNHDAAGKCIKAPRLWHDVTGFDVVIWIREHFWAEWDDHVRRAALLHELLHVEIKRDKENNAKVAVRKHDVEDFVAVVKHYGPIFGYGNGGSPAYVRAAELWRKRTNGAAHADDDADLRPKGEVNIDELRGDVDRAVANGARRLQDLADETGTTMTMRAGEREATIRPRSGRAKNGGQQPPAAN
jgi:hypothetical protein